MMKGLFSRKTVAIPSGTKIFGYASGSTTTLTDYTTSTDLTKTGEQWIAFIETVTGWQCSPQSDEFNIFSQDTFAPNRFKVYSASLANLLGFVKDTLYSKSNDVITSTYWGSFKLVLGGSKYTDSNGMTTTSILQTSNNEPVKNVESIYLVGFGPITDYIQTYDNQKFTLDSTLNHFSKQENFKQFNAFNCIGIGSIVTSVNIPQLSYSTKTLKVGLLKQFQTDLIPSKSMNKISYTVAEVS